MLGWGMFGWECLFVSGSDMQDLKTRSDWDDLQAMLCAEQALMDEITSAPKPKWAADPPKPVRGKGSKPKWSYTDDGRPPDGLSPLSHPDLALQEIRPPAADPWVDSLQPQLGTLVRIATP